MIKSLNEKGGINVLLVSTIVLLLLFIGTTVTTVMYYGKYSQYKGDVQPLIDEAVDAAKVQQKQELDVQFAEEHKKPFDTYQSSSEYGSIQITYPRTWSAAVAEGTSSQLPLDGSFHPGFVPAPETKTKYALRLELANESTEQTLRKYENAIKRGTIVATPLEISGVDATRLDGELTPEVSGAMVVVKLRDKTLRIWTESSDFTKDFTETIIANLKFSP